MSDYGLSQLPKPQHIKAGDVILVIDDVFLIDATGKPAFAGKRDSTFKVLWPSKIPGSVTVEVVKSNGINSFAKGSEMTKPVANLMRGHLVSEAEPAYKSGGYLEGVDASGKKIVTDDASKGGLYVGSKHSEGGIKGVVGPEQRPIEVESGEISMAATVSDDSNSYDFNGKKMSAKDILSVLNEKNGGVKLARGGQADLGTDSHPLKYKGKEIILTAPVTTDQTKYEFEGKSMTPREIASHINVQNNGVAFATGGSVSHCMCSGKSFKLGGKTMTDYQIVRKINNCGCKHSIEKGYERERLEHYGTLSKLNSGEITIDQALKEMAETHLEQDPNYYNR